LVVIALAQKRYFHMLMQFLFPHLEWVIVRYKECYTLFVFIPLYSMQWARGRACVWSVYL